MIEQMKDTDVFMQKYQQLLQYGETLMLPVLGHSMAPFLMHKRDAVWLRTSIVPYKVGDIVLYRRKSGSYILHRICKIKKDTYTMVGDAHTVVESDIQKEQILAVVVYAQRNGKIQKPGKFWWEFFSRIWIRIIPLRPLIVQIYSRMKRIFRRVL